MLTKFLQEYIMGLLFYYDLRSQPCRSVYLFLKANGIKYESKLIELPNGKMTVDILVYVFYIKELDIA